MQVKEDLPRSLQSVLLHLTPGCLVHMQHVQTTFPAVMSHVSGTATSTDAIAPACKDSKTQWQSNRQGFITSSLGSMVTTVYNDVPPYWPGSSALPLRTLPDNRRLRTPPSASSTGSGTGDFFFFFFPLKKSVTFFYQSHKLHMYTHTHGFDTFSLQGTR